MPGPLLVPDNPLHTFTVVSRCHQNQKLFICHLLENSFRHVVNPSKANQHCVLVRRTASSPGKSSQVAHPWSPVSPQRGHEELLLESFPMGSPVTLLLPDPRCSGVLGLCPSTRAGFEKALQPFVSSGLSACCVCFFFANK